MDETFLHKARQLSLSLTMIGRFKSSVHSSLFMISFLYLVLGSSAGSQSAVFKNSTRFLQRSGAISIRAAVTCCITKSLGGGVNKAQTE